MIFLFFLLISHDLARRHDQLRIPVWPTGTHHPREEVGTPQCAIGVFSLRSQHSDVWMGDLFMGYHLGLLDSPNGSKWIQMVNLNMIEYVHMVTLQISCWQWLAGLWSIIFSHKKPEWWRGSDSYQPIIGTKTTTNTPVWWSSPSSSTKWFELIRIVIHQNTYKILHDITLYVM